MSGKYLVSHFEILVMFAPTGQDRGRQVLFVVTYSTSTDLKGKSFEAPKDDDVRFPSNQT